MKKFNFVYKTTNNINNKFYFGVHYTDDLDDGYIGSGKIILRSINKYGKKNHTRKIIKFFEKESDAYKLESIIVTEKLLEDRLCMNLNLGGR